MAKVTLRSGDDLVFEGYVGSRQVRLELGHIRMVSYLSSQQPLSDTETVEIVHHVDLVGERREPGVISYAQVALRAEKQKLKEALDRISELENMVRAAREALG